ncbi:unnamed protein product [Chilo suppressalis]|uniref:Uncharacterized protein n=1 Tax=Chilo suppressalis TaxID=168631 RepID=A0ABN8AQ80_CHISP|nr:unnamed protein product [Chilo suppressalis]
MPLKRTPPPQAHTNVDIVVHPDGVSTASSTVVIAPPRKSDMLIHMDTVLNKSASDSDLSRTNPTTTVSQRNKRGREQIEDSISNQMDDFKEEMRKLFKLFSASQTKELKQLNTALKEIQNSNNNIESSVAYLAAQNEEFKQRIVELETQAKQDRNYITMLESKLEEIQIASRKSSFEIKNVPKMPKENKEELIEMMINLSKSVDCSFSKSDINDIYRVRSKSDNKNPPIVVETKSTLLKVELLKLAKLFNTKHKSKLCGKHLGYKTQEDIPIFLSEYLTPKSARLYFLARDLAKSKNFKFC